MSSASPLNSALTQLTFTELTPGPGGQEEAKGHIRESKHLPLWPGDPDNNENNGYR